MNEHYNAMLPLVIFLTVSIDSIQLKDPEHLTEDNDESSEHDGTVEPFKQIKHLVAVSIG